MKRYVLDSFAMIAFFENEPGADLVAQILREILDGKAKGFMSTINWGEIYYNTLREQGAETAEKTLVQFDKYGIELVPADRAMTYEAAILKGSFRMAYADCFAAALALRMKVPLVTGDPDFRRMGDKITVTWIEKKPASRSRQAPRQGS